MGKPVKCFIVEGAERDYRFVTEMINTFFRGKYCAVTICLPAEQNLYMLYKKLADDGFETDLIELLREENLEAQKALEGIERQRIDEVFLFFDYDIHQNNLKPGQDPQKALWEMISYYSNETENGKLYISYPMVEALYDYIDGYCQTFTNCFYPISQLNSYKDNASGNSRNSSRHYTRHDDWRMVLSIFGLRIQCLFNSERLDYDFYSKNVTVKAIFDLQSTFTKEQNAIFVLSAFPEFLLDYFKKDFWKAHINRHKKKYQVCPKEMGYFPTWQKTQESK